MSVLRRIAGERYSEVLKAWEGQTVALLAGGPSLSLIQVEAVHRLHLKTVAINDCYLVAPWADLCYFADSIWWGWHTKGVAKPGLGLSAADVAKRFREFAGEKCSILWSGSNIEDDAVHILHCKRQAEGDEHGGGISLDARMLVSGRSSGYQAINLAILAGAKKILLLGYDGKADAQGRNHWHGGHPVGFDYASVFEQQRKMFSAAERAIAATGVKVINCNPESALNSFQKMTLDEALA